MQIFGHHEIKPINVPQFEEFWTSKIWDQLQHVPKIRQYTPDLTDKELPNREFLLKVVDFTPHWLTGIRSILQYIRAS
jgi:hypothetical protein